MKYECMSGTSQMPPASTWAVSAPSWGQCHSEWCMHPRKRSNVHHIPKPVLETEPKCVRNTPSMLTSARPYAFFHLKGFLEPRTEMKNLSPSCHEKASCRLVASAWSPASALSSQGGLLKRYLATSTLFFFVVPGMLTGAF